MSKKKPKSKVFDAQLFKRLLHYIKPYTGFFILALTTVIGLAVFGALRPKVLQLAIDQNIEQKFEPPQGHSSNNMVACVCNLPHVGSSEVLWGSKGGQGWSWEGLVR